MMRRSFFALAATGLAAVLMSATSAHAGTSTQGLVSLGADTQNGTSYSLGNWSPNAAQTGNFSGYPNFASSPALSFGDVTFDTAGTGSGILTFTNATYGTFTSSSVKLEGSAGGNTQYLVLGTWTPGSHSTMPASQAASVSLSITSNGGTLGASGVLSVPPVPEPSSVVLGLTSLAIGGLTYGLRRRRAGK